MPEQDHIQTQSRPKWFVFLASTLFMTATTGVAYRVGSDVNAGTFSWWPYPALTLLIILILAADWLVSRQSSSDAASLR